MAVNMTSGGNMCNKTVEKDIDDLFKPIYKHYKRRDRPCNVENVIDFSRSSILLDKRVEEFQLQETGLDDFPGMIPLKEWKAYILKASPGFIVIKNPFKAKYQCYWIKRCLLDFSTKPNTTNLDAHMERPSQVWHSCVNKENEPDLTKDSLLMKLRWATLGYQYEWNTKEYFSNRIQAFPDDLKHICSYIAALVGFKAYSSEAGIVNYYRMESTLMGHTDVSELDKAAPLISFSFGQSCIFLIGGPTKETEPVPLFLHSGDICIMTSEARLSYHAVPRIHPVDKNYFHSCFHDKSDNQTVTSIGDVEDKITQSIDASEMNSNLKDIENERTDMTEVSKVDEVEKDLDSDTEDDPYRKSERKRIFMENIVKLENDNNNSETIIDTETVKGDNCNRTELSELMDMVVNNLDWQPFEKYVAQSRINVNVRQVLKPGLSLGPSPSVIVPCQGKN